MGEGRAAHGIDGAGRFRRDRVGCEEPVGQEMMRATLSVRRCCRNGPILPLLALLAQRPAFAAEVVPGGQPVPAVDPAPAGEVEPAGGGAVDIQLVDGKLSANVRSVPLSQVVSRLTSLTVAQVSWYSEDREAPISASFKNLPLEQGIHRLLAARNHLVEIESETGGRPGLHLWLGSSAELAAVQKAVRAPGAFAMPVPVARVSWNAKSGSSRLDMCTSRRPLVTVVLMLLDSTPFRLRTGK